MYHGKYIPARRRGEAPREVEYGIHNYKKTEGSFDVYVLKFDQKDREVSSLMYEKRILNQKNMGVGCISVKYSEKAYAFKLTYTPGSDARKVMKKIEGKINVAAYFFGRHGNGMDDIFSDIFGGTFRRG